MDSYHYYDASTNETKVYSTKDALYEAYPTMANVRSGLAQLFSTMSVYPIAEVIDHGRCDTVVYHTPSDMSSLTDSFGLLQTTTGVRSDTAIPLSCAEAVPYTGSREAAIEASLNPELCKATDYLFSDYTVITYERPRAGKPVYNGFHRLKLTKANRCDFSLGLAPNFVFSELPEALKAVPPCAGSMSYVCVLHPTVQTQYKPLIWFVASHQFYRLYLLVTQGPSHVSFGKHVNLKNWLARSTNMVTAGFRKWSLGFMHHGAPPPAEEASDRLWVTRTESSSRDHCHVYLALALISVYNEMPSAGTLPKGGRDTPPMLYWDLPSGFLYNIAMLLSRGELYQRSPKYVDSLRVYDDLLTRVTPSTDVQRGWFEDADEDD